MRVAGVILAGGLSRRMGGGDKALLPLAGKPLLAHVIGRLAPQVEALILNANGDPARFSDFGLPVVPDIDENCSGPLAGILAVVTHVRQALPHIEAIVSIPADTPFAPSDLVARLEGASSNADVAMATSAGRDHPTVALWRVSLREPLASALSRDERRVLSFIEGQKHARVDWPTESFDPFANINSPDDLARAETVAARL